MDAGVFFTQQRRLEKCLGATEPNQFWSVTYSQERYRNVPLVSNIDNLPIRQLIRLLNCRALGSGLDLLLKIEGDITQLLFNVPYNLSLGARDELVPSLHE